MRATAFPLADDKVAFGDQLGRAPEIEVGKRSTKIGHERLDVITTAARFVQRVVEQHVRRSDLVDDREIDILTPKLSKPATNDGLIAVFFAYLNCPNQVVSQGSSNR